MASVKDKLSQLGRPMVEMKLMSRDETQEISVWYQCLTTLNERILREAMREQFDVAVLSFKVVKPGDTISLYARWLKEFEDVGLDKCAKFIVASDRIAIRAEAIREMDKPPVLETATEDEKAAWIAEFSPIFERLVEENVAAMKDNELSALAEKAVDLQITEQANKVAYDIYRLRLIQESILEPITKDDGTIIEPVTYKKVFDSSDEVEKLLAPSTIDDLSTKISDEVRLAKSIPLK